MRRFKKITDSNLISTINNRYSLGTNYYNAYPYSTITAVAPSIISEESKINIRGDIMAPPGLGYLRYNGVWARLIDEGKVKFPKSTTPQIEGPSETESLDDKLTNGFIPTNIY